MKVTPADMEEKLPGYIADHGRDYADRLKPADEERTAAIVQQKRPMVGDEVVIDQVMMDFDARARFGCEKHGQLLATYDGRDNLVDLYQELIDAAMYCKKELMERETPTSIPALQKEIHQNAVAHGWWESERPVPETLCLIHSEVSEALEAYREHDTENFAEELADVAILLMSASEEYGINLEREILKKHAKNKKRSYRHGGKAV